MTRPSLAVCVFAVVAAAASLPEAQGRGGGRGGGRGSGGGASSIERITVHAKSLEGNKEGDTPERQVTVYLPPSYAADQTRQFPVVYLLHGAGGDDTFTTRLANLPESADRLSSAQGFSDLIVVMPNATTTRPASMYATGTATGNWETFLAEELVAAIDSRYRTYAGRMSRGIGGHAAGATAAFRIAMKRPDVFSSVYAMSPCCVDGGGAAAVAVTEREVDALRSLYAIAIDIGTKDPELARTQQLHQALTKLRVAHRYEEYDGDASTGLRDRMGRNVLPFFSQQLASPANPSSPPMK